MDTKVQNFSSNPIPAGLTGDGIEAFTRDGKKYIIAEGRCTTFEAAKPEHQRHFATLFQKDKEAQHYMKTRMGIVGFMDSFNMWFNCKFGGLDGTPDLDNDGNLISFDAYQNTCAEQNCPHRGKFCSKLVGLKSHEIQLIRELAQGETIEQAAHNVCISHAGAKSKLETIKSKINAPNLAAVMTRTAAMGAI